MWLQVSKRFLTLEEGPDCETVLKCSWKEKRAYFAGFVTFVWQDDLLPTVCLRCSFLPVHVAIALFCSAPCPQRRLGTKHSWQVSVCLPLARHCHRRMSRGSL